MKTLTGLLCVSIIASTQGTKAVAAEPAPQRASVVVLPPVADPKVPVGLALAMQEKASALLLGTGRYDVVHARQVRSMALRHRMSMEALSDPNLARQAAERLGASYFVFSRLTSAKGGFSASVSVGQRGEAKVQSATLTLPAADDKAVAEGGRALAVELTKYDGSKAPEGDAQPLSSKESAMRNYAACDSRLSGQPVGIENPFLLNDTELKKAIASCETAVKTDPDFAAAWGALAFASALCGNDARAVEALTRIKPESGHNPNAMAARFWLVSRYQSSEAAVAVLKDAVAKEPGFLLARVYLAELYNALGRHEEAAKAWQEYAAHSEGNAFVISRLAYTLSRLGKTRDAAAFAEKAMAYDPESFDLALEQSSRLIDDGQVDKALALLEPLAAKKDAPAELVLRLGYAKMLKGELDLAGKLMNQAFDLAKDTAEWRTRARAKANLAELLLKREAKDKAKAAVADALKEGLRPSAVKPELLALLSEAEVKAAEAKGLGKVKPKEGTAVPEKAAAAAPTGFEKVKVAQ
jgi:tetratricopeptide (TPR) repeat protein